MHEKYLHIWIQNCCTSIASNRIILQGVWHAVNALKWGISASQIFRTGVKRKQKHTNIPKAQQFWLLLVWRMAKHSMRIEYHPVALVRENPTVAYCITQQFCLQNFQSNNYVTSTKSDPGFKFSFRFPKLLATTTRNTQIQKDWITKEWCVNCQQLTRNCMNP